MNNLIAKSISYEGLRTVFNGDDYKTCTEIKFIESNELKQKLINEAKQFWAKRFNIDESEVFFGNLTIHDSFNEQYKIILGDASINMHANTSNLIGVVGSLCACKGDFPKLKFVTNILKVERECVVSLPKLSHVHGVVLRGCEIKRLPLKKCVYADLTNSEICDFHLENVSTLHLNNADYRQGILKCIKHAKTVYVPGGEYSI